MKKVLIYGGGTVSYIRPHLALTAPAYGATAREIQSILTDESRFHARTHTHWFEHDVRLRLTRMAEPDSKLETNADVASRLDRDIADPDTHVVFMSTAFCDFDGSVLDEVNVPTASGKDQPRLLSKNTYDVRLTAAEKVLNRIRRERKDIFLVGFKTTTGATTQAQFDAGLGLLKGASCNLVLANDLHTRVNMVITPEEVPYAISTNRGQTLHMLVEMAMDRAEGHFTRSQVVPGDLVSWGSDMVPESLRDVVNDCINAGAYKPFNGKTVGHFAFRGPGNEIITSIRKSNFNDLASTGMVRIESTSPDSVVAYGAKPSVGGQSQRSIFARHTDVDSIVHFHCPIKPEMRATVSTVSQAPYECGSHECGNNTSSGLMWHSYHGSMFKAVYLDGHGPNIAFNSKTTNPQAVKDFIHERFDLSVSTGAQRIREFDAASA